MKARPGFLLPIALAALTSPAFADPRCAGCHRKAVEGYLRTGMGRSLGHDYGRPAGRVVHKLSGTSFAVERTAAGMTQRIERGGLAAAYQIAFAIGSGNRAYGYLVQVGDCLFQSPLAYYSKRRAWDMAPGFENAEAPDFNRPVTLECLLCHAGALRIRIGSLNRYETPRWRPRRFPASAATDRWKRI